MYGHEKRPLPEKDALDGSQAYRLKEWPQIPDRFRTARVLGVCSRMTVGPVTANWFVTQTGLAPEQAAELIAELAKQGALDCIDLGPRAGGQPAVTRVAPTAVEKLRGRLAQRFPWRQAALAAIVCLGISAALDERFPGGFGPIALPNLPVFSG